VSALSNLTLTDSWLGAVHKSTYAVSRSRGFPCAEIFRTGVYSNADVRTFVAKTNIEFFKIYRGPHLTWTRGMRGERD